MSASRLRFNPSKTEIMWLGAWHLLQQVDISDIPVLSSTVRVVQSARDLGVISQLSVQGWARDVKARDRDETFVALET